MKIFLKFFLKIVTSLAIFILSVSISLAQPPGGGGGEDPDAEIPIDGGIGYLAAAGIAYGAKKIYDKKKQKEENK